MPTGQYYWTKPGVRAPVARLSWNQSDPKHKSCCPFDIRESVLGASAHGKWRLVRPAVCDAADHHRYRLQLNLPGALVVARVDKLDGPFDDLEHRGVARRTHLERAELAPPIYDAGRLAGGHGDDLLQAEAHVQEFAHDPGEIGHAGRIGREDVDIR